jgi:hypothetical protein
VPGPAHRGARTPPPPPAGLPVNFADDEVAPSFAQYAAVLRTRVPALFEANTMYRVITEYGRALSAKAGWVGAAVEYVKLVDDSKAIATVQVGARQCLRAPPLRAPLRSGARRGLSARRRVPAVRLGSLHAIMLLPRRLSAPHHGPPLLPPAPTQRAQGIAALCADRAAPPCPARAAGAVARGAEHAGLSHAGLSARGAQAHLAETGEQLTARKGAAASATGRERREVTCDVVGPLCFQGDKLKSNAAAMPLVAAPSRRRAGPVLRRSLLRRSGGAGHPRVSRPWGPRGLTRGRGRCGRGTSWSCMTPGPTRCPCGTGTAPPTHPSRTEVDVPRPSPPY